MPILEVPRLVSDTDAGSGQVNVPREVIRAVIEREGRDAMLGMVAGIVVILLGAWMVIAGLTSTASEIVIKLGEAEITVTTALPGVVFALIGLAVIFLTRPKVGWQSA